MASFEEQKQEVIDKLDIVDIIGEFIPLEKTGANFKGCCPFHDEATPSFIVSPQKKMFNCFGCHTGGDAIQFVKLYKNISYNEALAFCAKKAGVNININIKKDDKQNFTKYYHIMEIAQKFYQRNLLSTKSGLEALEYLNKRGLDEETIKVFGIGLAPSQRDVVYQVLKDNEILDLDMTDTGIVKAKTDDKSNIKFYDLFNSRIMFPILDENNNVVGFSGRIYKTDPNSPKYINSPESIIFKKSNVLFNFGNARQEILRKKRVILHEGQMDVIASYKAGLKEVVCSLGTALTIEQAKLIKAHTNDVIICYDADSAGVNASIRAIDILRGQGLNVKMVMLEGAKDPDEFVLKYGNEEYLRFFEKNIVEPVEYLYKNAIRNRDLKNITEVEQAKNEIFSILAKEKSQTLIEGYLNRFSDVASLSFSSLMIDYNTYFNIKPISKVVEKQNDFKKSEKTDGEFLKSRSKYSLAELRLFQYAKESKDKAQYIDKKINISCFEKLHQSLWLQLIDMYYDFYDDFDETKFLNLLSENEEIFRCYTSDMNSLSKYKDIKYTEEDLKICIDIFNEKLFQTKVIDLDRRINNTNDFEEKIRLTQEKFDVIKNFQKNKKARV